MPYGSVVDVGAEVRRVSLLGRDGGYILPPSHALEGDVPVENLIALIEEAQRVP